MSAHIPACYPVPLGKKGTWLSNSSKSSEMQNLFPKAVAMALSSSLVVASAAPILCFNILPLPIP